MFRVRVFFVVLACVARCVLGAAVEARVTPAPNPWFASDQKFKLALQKKDDIFRRDGAAATCGYATEDYGNPITCGSGYDCVYWPALPVYKTDYNLTLQTGAVDCCAQSGSKSSVHFSSCLPSTTCIDYAEASASSLANTAGALVCDSSAPSCATFAFIGAPDIFGTGTLASSEAAAIYTALYCNSVKTLIKVFQTYTNSPSSTTPPSSSSSSSSSTSSTKSTPSSTSTSASAPVSNSGSSTSTGTIAGAAVGGFVGVAAIAAGVGYLIWRQTRTRPPASPEISQISY